MPAVNLGSLLEKTEEELDRLRQRYAALRSSEPSGSVRHLLAEILYEREADTIRALRGYRARNEDRHALDTHVRLGGGFPFEEKALQWPEDPQLDDLLELAEASDEALEQLGERVRIYSAGEELREALEALDSIVADRRRRLADAAHELRDEYAEPGRSS